MIRERSWQGLTPGPFVALAAMLLYARTIGFAYVDWDDTVFLVDNPLLQHPSLSTLQTLLRPRGVEGEWLYIPVTYLSFYMEALLGGGLNAAISHIVNAALHALNTVLVLRLAGRLKCGTVAAVVAALLFACHPLQVEAVAWSMGRKDLLAAFFVLLAMECWEVPGPRPFAVALLAVTLAMLAKPTAVIAPGLLLLADWHARRLNRERLMQLLPAVAIAGALLVLNLRLGPAEGGMDLHNEIRCWQLPWTICDFLQRLILRQPPAVLYLPHRLTPETIAIGPVIAVLLLLLTGWTAWRTRQRVFLFAAGFAILAMLPVFNIYLAAKIFITADRFSYLAMAGLAVALASLPIPRAPWLLAAVLLLLALPRTNRQINIWRDTDTLHAAALRQNPANPIFAYDAGLRLEALDQPRAARRRYLLLLTDAPLDARAHLRLGVLAAREGDRASAQRHFAISAGVDPGSRELWREWTALYGAADPAMTLHILRRAARHHPDWPQLQEAINRFSAIDISSPNGEFVH